ncbi:MAG: hypothetical protein Q9218_007084 [Villophora microphyllina]
MEVEVEDDVDDVDEDAGEDVDDDVVDTTSGVDVDELVDKEEELSILDVVAAAVDEVVDWEVVVLVAAEEDVVELVVAAMEDVVERVDDMLELVAEVIDVVVDDLTIGGGRTNGEQGSVDIRSLAT